MTFTYDDLKSSMHNLESSFTIMDLAVERAIDQLELLPQSIFSYKKAKMYLRNKNKAYLRSVRNQKTPIHVKKHGRQQRTKRRV